MAKYVVAKGNGLMDETVDAHSVEILRDGSLVFREDVRLDAERGWGARLIMAFAPGRWVEVMELHEPPQA